MTSAEAPTAARVDRQRLPRGLDALLDGIVVAFAAWTVFYEVALPARLNLWVPSLVWLVLAAVAIAGYVARTVLRTPGGPPEDGEPPEEPEASPRPGSEAAAVGVAAMLPWAIAVTALIVAVLLAPLLGELPAVLVSLVVLALGIRGRLRVVSFAPQATSRPGFASHLWAVGVSVGLAVFTACLIRPNGDDVYYVNRSAWVADHGFAAFRDTMFGPLTYPSTYGGGLPLTSIEPLLGGLSHSLGLQVGTVVYLLTAPVLGFLMGLATWRLVRAWAPRRHLLVLVVAVAFVLFSAQTIVGGYASGRIWEGKVVSYCVLLPLIWVQLGRVIERGTLRGYLLLGCSGVALVGLSATAALQAPMIGGPALVAAALLRRRSLAIGAVALMAAPVVAGIVQVVWSSSVGGAHPQPMELARTWDMLFGHRTAMIVLAVLAYAVAVQLPRGRQAVVVSCAALAAMATLLPGMFVLANLVTGAGPVEWRLLIGIPTAVLVGLLVTVRLPAMPTDRLRRLLPETAVTALIVALIGGALVGQGSPLWRNTSGNRLGSPTAWKLDAHALSDVQDLMRVHRHTGPGPWLLPAGRMEVLTIVTTQHAAVVPRLFYLPTLSASAGNRGTRRFLYRFVEGDLHHRPDPARVRRALDRLHVSLACVRSTSKGRGRILAAAVGDPGHRVGGLVCHTLGSPAAGGSSSTTAQ